MAKQQGKGVQVGSKVKVWFLKSGTRQDGYLWQLFTCQESSYNQETNKYTEIGKYTIFANNSIQGLQNGDMVTINSITKALIEKNIKNNIEYTNVNLWCDITLETVYQPRLVDNQNQQPQLENTQMETPNFSDEFGIDEDSLPF